MPDWVDKCVQSYLDEGVSKKEAWKRCMGAYNKRKKETSKPEHKRSTT